MNKKTKFEKLLDFLAGKGFYIILFVCVVAIAVSGYILLFGGDDGDPADLTLDNGVNWLDPDETGDRTAQTSPTGQPALNPEDGEAIEVLNPAVIETTPSPSLKPVAPSVAPPTPKPSTKPAPPEAAVKPSPSEKPPAAPAKTTYIWPVAGEVIVSYADDKLLYNKTMDDWRAHVGLDIGANAGSQVMACQDGVVKDIYADPKLGTCVVVEHKGGMASLYANLQEVVTVKLEQKVKAGDVLGGVGKTASFESADEPHLHFEMYKDGKQVNPLDYLPKK